MDRIITNILKFENKPFTSSFTIFKYKKKEYINFSQLGDILRSLRKTIDNRSKIIIQYGNYIISTELMKDDIKNNLKKHFVDHDIELISARSEENLEIIRRILGEAIAVNLRHDANKLWKIEEIYNSIFEVSSPENLKGFGEIDVFPGFQYSPIVLENGDAGIIVDLKYKFHSSNSLRDKLSYTSIKINLESNYVDICPVKDCPEKKDPFSNCRLAGTGDSVHLKKIVEKSPREILINGIDLIKFHEKENICPQSPLLASKIIDRIPVVMSTYQDENDNYYHYPIERIREKPTFRLLDSHDRGRLMQQIRPQPYIRYRRSNHYLLDIKQIAIGSISLTPDRKQLSWGNENTGELDSIDYLVRDNTTNYPSIQAQEYGIYDKNYEKLTLQPILFRKYTDKELTGIKSPFSKVKDRIVTLKNFIDSQIDILLPIVIDNDESAPSIISKLELNENICVLLIHSSKDNISGESKEILSKKLLLEDIPNQGMNFETFVEKYEDRQNGYFRNIYLGIIAKIRLMAWLLNVKENENIKFIGMSSSHISGDEIKYEGLFTSYLNSGRFIEGYYLSTKTENRLVELTKLFKKLIQKNEEIVILYHGKLRENELKDMVVSIESIVNDYSIVEIISSSPLRIFRKSGTRVYSPNNGSYVKISKDEVGLVTTSGSIGTPNPIIIRKIKSNESRFDKLLKEIFYLSQCYTGWDKNETRLPVPNHTSSRGMKKLPDDMPSFYFKSPWFI